MRYTVEHFRAIEADERPLGVAYVPTGRVALVAIEQRHHTQHRTDRRDGFVQPRHVHGIDHQASAVNDHGAGASRHRIAWVGQPGEGAAIVQRQ